VKNYSIKKFVADLLAITAKTRNEDEILSQVAPLARRAAAEPHWRSEDMYITDHELGFGSTLLHAESDNSLFIVIDSGLPGRGVRPHDHGTWAVVVGVTGPEHNVFWERVDDRSQENHSVLKKTHENIISIGETLCMKTGEIHSVENRTDETTLSFHVYGRHLNFTGRSRFDVENNLEIPFLMETK